MRFIYITDIMLLIPQLLSVTAAKTYTIIDANMVRILFG